MKRETLKKVIECIDCGKDAVVILHYASGPEPVCDDCDGARLMVMRAFPHIYGDTGWLDPL